MELSERINQAIRDIPDFPKPGILFKDITPMLLDPALSRDIVSALSLEHFDATAVCGVESRGFLFGLMLAERLRLPFIPVRKKGKLPGETIGYAYDLEYGSAEIEIHKGDLPAGSKVLIHDDLLATGGTAAGTAELIQLAGSEVAGYSFLIELDFLQGRSKLEAYTSNIFSLVHY